MSEDAMLMAVSDASFANSYVETKWLALDICIFLRISESIKGSFGNIASLKSFVVAIIRFFHKLSLSSSSAALKAETEAAELCVYCPPFMPPYCFLRRLQTWQLSMRIQNAWCI